MSETLRTQKHRHLAITTPLGEDKVILMAMYGNEALSQLFQYELDLLSESDPIDPQKILCKNVTIRLNMPGDKTRYFNGYISRLSLVAVDDSHEGRRLFSYRASMVPWVWFLTRHADCRIFQDKTVPDILKVFFTESTEYQLSGTFKPKEYCVQYRETDFNFVSRLMENEGIYYYFKHVDGQHKLVVCNTANSNEPVKGYEKLLFHEPSSDPDTDAYIWDWSISQEVTPTKEVVTDFNPLQPKDNLLESHNVTHPQDPNPFEIFDYPGGYVTADEGRVYVRTRMEEAESQYITAHASSSARGIYAGAIFTLDSHPVCDSEDYLITAIHYQLRNDDLGLGGRVEGELFHCEFSAIPKKYEFRPARTTPKPFVQGPQTAIVVGKAGEEIWTDKYGRVKVNFHWDRHSAKNETASCWIRVSQPWAGKNWGNHFIPRMGMEVVVTFLEGDPDRPLVTGSVYNGDNLFPYTLPDNKTQSGVKSRSSKEGTADNFNEIRFEDKKGSEEFYVHAEKDMNRVVENNDTLKVGSSKKDKGDQTIEIFNNQSITVGFDQCTVGSRIESMWNNEETTIGGGKGQAADGSQLVGIWNNQEITIGSGQGQNSDGSQIVEIWKNRTVTIDTGNDTLEIKQGDRTVTIDTGNDSYEVKMGNRAVKVDMGNDSLAVSMGNQSVKCDLGAISNEAMQGIELKVGSNSIKIDQMGVTITGMMVKIEGQVQTEVKGLMCQVSGDAMLQAKGAITMIG